jgi:hypothetical protein
VSGRALLAVGVLSLIDPWLVGCGGAPDPFASLAAPDAATLEAAVDGAVPIEAAADVADGGTDGDTSTIPDASVADTGNEASPDAGGEAGTPCTTSWECTGYGDAGGFDPSLGVGFCCQQGGPASCSPTCPPPGLVVCIVGHPLPCPYGTETCVPDDAGSMTGTCQ